MLAEVLIVHADNNSLENHSMIVTIVHDHAHKTAAYVSIHALTEGKIGRKSDSRPTRAPHRHRFAANSPVVGIHLVDYHYRGGRILVQHLAQQLGRADDRLGFLCRRDAFSGNLNIDIRHVGFLQTEIQTRRSTRRETSNRPALRTRAPAASSTGAVRSLPWANPEVASGPAIWPMP